MDAEESPPRSIASHLRGALGACRDAFARLPKLALDIALPTLCVSCREPWNMRKCVAAGAERAAQMARDGAWW